MDPKKDMMQGASPPCQTCHNILHAFSHPHTYYELNLGSFIKIADSTCPNHTPLLLAFRGDIDPNSRLIFSRGDMRLEASKGCSVWLREVPYGTDWRLLLLRNPSLPGHTGTAVILDQDWVGIDRVKVWKDQCIKVHADRCQNPMRIWPTRPAWLVDVEARCVVPGAECESFVALSYRLGRHAGLRVNVELMAKLQQPFILDSAEISPHVPPIVRHAMYLTSFMGERYLWADIFCIIHGNSAETAAQLSLMSAIYASAVVTIVAADGDALDGIPGLADISGSRKLQQQIIPFGDERVVVRNTDAKSLIKTPYHARGWTYQEYAMSARKILFLNGELHWECQCSTWHEETTLWTELDKTTDQQLHLMLAGVPDLPSLGEAFNEYNVRNLTYDEDALPAISGLLSVLNRSFRGGFIYGLPEMLFDAALSWSPLGHFSDLRRRRVSGRSGDNRLADSGLPSWSWIGWQGGIVLGENETFQFQRGATKIQETVPIATWYTSESPRGSARRRIQSTWFEERNRFKDSMRLVPPGWTRHDGLPNGGDKPEQYLYPDECGAYHYTHPSIPNTAWYYPFPIAETAESTPTNTPSQTPYLFCKTARAMLWPRQRHWHDWHVLDLCTESGDMVGLLHLHNKDQMQGFPKNDGAYPSGVGDEEDPDEEEEAEDAPVSGKAVELVAISRSRTWGREYNEEEKRFQHPPYVRDTYKVLWVEWEDGVAYRLAAGDVMVEEWDSLELEEVDLILG
ncbi:heterokaryon incompatibility protein-domain-containing protein [Aspergillus crustosus]